MALSIRTVDRFATITGKADGNQIDNGAIANAHISETADIARSKLADAAALNILMGGPTVDADAQHTHTSKLNASAILSGRVTAQFDSTSETLANVPGLSVTLVAGKTYIFRAYLFTQGAGAKVGLGGGTATATAIRADIHFYNLTAEEAINAKELRVTALTGSLGWSDNAPKYCIVEGVITVNQAGTFILQWATPVAGIIASVLTGSYITAMEIP
jgi:hypothetical protein